MWLSGSMLWLVPSEPRTDIGDVRSIVSPSMTVVSAAAMTTEFRGVTSPLEDGSLGDVVTPMAFRTAELSVTSPGVAWGKKRKCQVYDVIVSGL